MAAIPVERCASGIPGFDKLCLGGFVRNSVSAVAGGPGSGKSLFLLNFLWNGLQMNENGLYVSFEPDLMDVALDCYAMGWNFSKYEKEGKCKFLRLSPLTQQKEIEKQIMDIVSKHSIQRVCIDPISSLALRLENEAEIRERIYELCSLLKRLKVTVLLSDEIHGESSMDFSSGEKFSRHGVVEFLADTLITMHSMGIGGAADRAIRIVKMRRTNHFRGPVPMRITDRGIVVMPEQA
jgi:circadian clock protein KaiC